MNQKEYYNRLQDYALQLRAKAGFTPEIAIVLGSGLGNFADNIDVTTRVSYRELVGFPVSTAPGHSGEFIFGTLGGKKVVCMKGRIHYYEGYEMSEVVLPLRVMGLMGAKTVIITNAVGGINKDYNVGSFMVSKDCITSFIPSPLIGPNIEELGPRFVDVSQIYDATLRAKVLEIGEREGIEVHEGVFIQVTGPQFETATEIKAYRAMGADCCGMSSACEAIAAQHMGLKTCQISCITNMATGVLDRKLSGEEVIEVANQVSKKFETLVKKLVEEI